MATKMSTLKVFVIKILFLGLIQVIHGVTYDVSGVDRSYVVDIRADPGLHMRVRRQVDTDAPTPPPTMRAETDISVTSDMPTTTTTTTTSTTTTTTPTTTTTSPTTTPTTTPMWTTFPGHIDLINDTHQYYTSKTYRNNLGQHYYKDSSEVDEAIIHESLSNNHRSASSIPLSFNFPFYGHTVDQVTIATGGFIYMSEFLHQWLTATQYIAPLMANFDTQLGNDSRIIYADTGVEFYVWWENVYLQDEHEKGPFTFQLQLHRSGAITFAYKEIPIDVHRISTQEHPVKVGVSDAYYIDTNLGGNMKRRTIYEYHRVSITLGAIQSFGAVRLQPETVCHDLNSCHDCTTTNIEFDCAWCESLRMCSDGFNRHRQEWLRAQCHNDKGVSNRSNCPGETPADSPSPRESPKKDGGSNGSNSSVAGGALAAVIICILIVIALIILVVAWFVHAYRNPNSKAGRWLIEHRPSQLRESIAQKVRFWKKDSGTGDKYAVSVGGESVA